MTIAIAAAPAPERVSLRKIILPVEHGGWAMVGEALVLGLLVAPTLAGTLIAVAAIAAFLARQPLKIFAADRMRSRIYPRTRVSGNVALTFSILALASFAGAVTLANSRTVMLLAIAAGPFALVQLFHDVRNEGKFLRAEVCGAIAMSLVASMIGAAGFHPKTMILAPLVLMRSIPSIVYVRARLRLARSQKAATVAAVALHVAAAAATFAMQIAGFVSSIATAATGVLLIRAIDGISPRHRSASPQVVGFTEVAFGIITIAMFWLAL